MKPRTITSVAGRSVEVSIRRTLGLRPRPYKALLELTSQCNSRCVTCDIWKTPASVKKSDIALPEIESFLSGFGGDLVWLALSGGEVTLVEHFPQVIKAAKKSCPNLRLVTFTTNGLLPEKALEWANCISSNGFDSFITVSLDGDKSAHDSIRGVSGNYELALRALGLLRQAGHRAHFGITLGDGNREFVESRYASSALKPDIKAVTFVESGGIYRKKNSADNAGILESIAAILRGYGVGGPGELIEWIYLRLARAFFASGRKTLPLPCDVLRTSVHVLPNGDVRPCMFLPSLGNIRDEPIQSIVAGPAAKAQLAKIESGDCPRCWMNCYAPHSIMSRPLTALYRAVRA